MHPIPRLRFAPISLDYLPTPRPIGAPPQPGRGGASVPRREASRRSAFGGLSAALARAARTRCRRVSCFEARHCGPLSCPWPGLNGPFDGRPEACHRTPCPGAVGGCKAQNTWRDQGTTCPKQTKATLSAIYCKLISSRCPPLLNP